MIVERLQVNLHETRADGSCPGYAEERPRRGAIAQRGRLDLADVVARGIEPGERHARLARGGQAARPDAGLVAPAGDDQWGDRADEEGRPAGWIARALADSDRRPTGVRDRGVARETGLGAMKDPPFGGQTAHGGLKAIIEGRAD